MSYLIINKTNENTDLSNGDDSKDSGFKVIAISDLFVLFIEFLLINQ